MAALVLVMASFIFIVDAAFMAGKVPPQPAAVANLIVGTVIGIMGLYLGVTAGGNSALLVVSGLSMTFAMFYLMLALSILGGYSLEGVGWYCLGATLFVALASLYYFSNGDMRFGVFGLAWAVLFFAAFGSLALNKPWGKAISLILGVESIVTLLAPAYLMLAGMW